MRKVNLVRWYETKGDLHDAIGEYVDGSLSNGSLLELEYILEHFECKLADEDEDQNEDMSDYQREQVGRFIEAIKKFCLDNMVSVKDVIINYSW